MNVLQFTGGEMVHTVGEVVLLMSVWKKVDYRNVKQWIRSSYIALYKWASGAQSLHRLKDHLF